MHNPDRDGALRLVRPDGIAARPDQNDPLDSELIDQARAGSKTAWQVLVDRYLPTVWGLARRATGDEAAAGVVSQVVWLRLVQSLTCVGPEPLAMWLAAAVDEEAHRHKGTSGRGGHLRTPSLP